MPGYVDKLESEKEMQNREPTGKTAWGQKNPIPRRTDRSVPRKAPPLKTSITGSNFDNKVNNKL